MAKSGRVFMIANLLIVAFVLSQLGCGSISTDTEQKNRSSEQLTRSSVATTGTEAHDMSIAAIDFDPALRSNVYPAADNITLLVAIENRGSQVERDVIVEATLIGLPDSQILVSSQSTVKQIVAGESQVLRFSNFSSIPLRAAYTLKVEIRPVPEEASLGNNVRTYGLDVTVTSR